MCGIMKLLLFRETFNNSNWDKRKPEKTTGLKLYVDLVKDLYEEERKGIKKKKSEN